VISRYRLLAERIRAELQTLRQVVDRTKGALDRATLREQDQGYFSYDQLSLHLRHVRLCSILWDFGTSCATCTLLICNLNG
jgi:hypothetical protein